MEKIYKNKIIQYNMKRGVLVLFLALVVLINLSSVIADGAYFPEPGYWVRPGQQRAIIFYENNEETLILTSNFQGNAKDLVWIIPVPEKPEITKANEEIFTEIAKLAQPQYDTGISYGAMLKTTAGGDYESSVFVLESKKVDYYDVNVLAASNSQDLVRWFNENGYDYPEEYGYVLNHYISKNWGFVAIKVSPEAQGAKEIMQDLKEGHATPVKLVFESDKPVFPLKISSVDFKPEKENMDYYGSDYTSIQLYVIAGSKYEAGSNFYIQYGNWVKKSQIEKLGKDESGNPLIQPGEKEYFLTSLYANIAKSQMDNDIFLEPVNDNKKVNAGPETWQLFLYGLLTGLIVLLVWIFTPLGIMFIAGTLILFLSCSKVTRIFGWIMELSSLIITFIMAIAFLLISGINDSLGNYLVISVLVTSLLIIIAMFFLISLEIKYGRKE